MKLQFLKKMVKNKKLELLETRSKDYERFIFVILILSLITFLMIIFMREYLIFIIIIIIIIIIFSILMYIGKEECYVDMLKFSFLKKNLIRELSGNQGVSHPTK